MLKNTILFLLLFSLSFQHSFTYANNRTENISKVIQGLSSQALSFIQMATNSHGEGNQRMMRQDPRFFNCPAPPLMNVPATPCIANQGVSFWTQEGKSQFRQFQSASSQFSQAAGSYQGALQTWQQCSQQNMQNILNELSVRLPEKLSALRVQLEAIAQKADSVLQKKALEIADLSALLNGGDGGSQISEERFPSLPLQQSCGALSASEGELRQRFAKTGLQGVLNTHDQAIAAGIKFNPQRVAQQLEKAMGSALSAFQNSQDISSSLTGLPMGRAVEKIFAPLQTRVGAQIKTLESLSGRFPLLANYFPRSLNPGDISRLSNAAPQALKNSIALECLQGKNNSRPVITLKEFQKDLSRSFPQAGTCRGYAARINTLLADFTSGRLSLRKLILATESLDQKNKYKSCELTSLNLTGRRAVRSSDVLKEAALSCNSYITQNAPVVQSALQTIGSIQKNISQVTDFQGLKKQIFSCEGTERPLNTASCSAETLSGESADFCFNLARTCHTQILSCERYLKDAINKVAAQKQQSAAIYNQEVLKFQQVATDVLTQTLPQINKNLENLLAPLGVNFDAALFPQGVFNLLKYELHKKHGVNLFALEGGIAQGLLSRIDQYRQQLTQGFVPQVKEQLTQNIAQQSEQYQVALGSLTQAAQQCAKSAQELSTQSPPEENSIGGMEDLIAHCFDPQNTSVCEKFNPAAIAALAGTSVASEVYSLINYCRGNNPPEVEEIELPPTPAKKDVYNYLADHCPSSEQVNTLKSFARNYTDKPAVKKAYRTLSAFSYTQNFCSDLGAKFKTIYQEAVNKINDQRQDCNITVINNTLQITPSGNNTTCDSTIIKSEITKEEGSKRETLFNGEMQESFKFAQMISWLDDFKLSLPEEINPETTGEQSAVDCSVVFDEAGINAESLPEGLLSNSTDEGEESNNI